MKTITTERENGTRRVQILTEGPSVVEQSHRKACNINTIVAKAHKTGLFPERVDSPTYGDFTGTTDFHAAQNRIIKATMDFQMLPSGIRTRFDNDPGKLMDFLQDPDNAAEAIELGLLPQPEITEPVQPPAPEEPEEGKEKAAEPKE